MTPDFSSKDNVDGKLKAIVYLLVGLIPVLEHYDLC